MELTFSLWFLLLFVLKMRDWSKLLTRNRVGNCLFMSEYRHDSLSLLLDSSIQSWHASQTQFKNNASVPFFFVYMLLKVDKSSSSKLFSFHLSWWSTNPVATQDGILVPQQGTEAFEHQPHQIGPEMINWQPCEQYSRCLGCLVY